MEARRFFSVDSAKAIKAQSFGYLNGINYMAPAELAGVGNLCPHVWLSPKGRKAARDTSGFVVR